MIRYLFLFLFIQGCMLYTSPTPVNPVSYGFVCEGQEDDYLKDPLIMKTGERKFLRGILNSIYGVDTGFFERQFEWGVDDPSVASVKPDYYLYANSPGETNLRANGILRKNSFQIKIKVIENLFCRFIELTESSLKMKVGDVKKIQAKVHMSDGTINSNIIWDNLDDRICTIDDNGNIKAIGVGSTTITAIYTLEQRVKNTVKIYVVN